LQNYKENINEILSTKKFFFCGLDIHNSPIVGISPNYAKNGHDQEKDLALTPDDYENFFVYLFEDLFPNLLCQFLKLQNRLVILIDLKNGPLDVRILSKLVAVSRYHYLEIIKKIIIVNLSVENNDHAMMDLKQLVQACPEDLFLILGSNFKSAIISVVKPASFLIGYGGTKLYKNCYNFCNKEIAWDFD